MKRVRYPAEFKGEAVKEVTERGHGVVDVAKMLPPTPSSQVFSNCAEPPMTPICVPCAAQNLVFPGKWSCQSRIGKHCHGLIGVNRSRYPWVNLALSTIGLALESRHNQSKFYAAPPHKTMTLSADEFMRRFLLHVLPGGFHRIRHFGLIANNGRKEKLALVRDLLNVPTPPAATEVTAVDAEAEPVRANFVCAHCGALMVILETFVRSQTIRGPPLARGDS